MLGPGTGTSVNLSVVSSTPTETDVTFPGTSYPLWQLDFAVNFTAPGGTGYSFAIQPDGKPCNNASGNGESYYIAFLDCTMVGYSSGYPNDSSDGYVKDFYTGGTFCDTYTFPAVWGVVRAGDVSVQVFGVATVQTAGLPNLSIAQSGNSVIVSWPDPATNSYTLQQNKNLAIPGGWKTSGYSITTANGTNSITITPSAGNLFFRLEQ